MDQYKDSITRALPSLSLSTQSVHADDHLNVVDDVAPPVHITTTFRYPRDPSLLRPHHERTQQPVLDIGEHCYSRQSTPGGSRLETILSTLLKNPCISYSSGLAAFHALLTFLNPKKVSIGDGYHGCHGTLGLHERTTGCKVLPLDCATEELGEGDLIHLETPVNPTGRAFDIQLYADKAHSRGAYLSVDSTFAPPPLQDPFLHGADIVMHSGTKYIGGHSDMLCGVLAIKKHDWFLKLLEDRLFLGSVMGGLESWLGMRSIRTLELRVLRQSESATRIVCALHTALEGKDSVLSAADTAIVRNTVKEIHHCSLQTADFPWLRNQMPRGFGPVFAIALKDCNMARHFPSKLLLFHHATSLGGVESLIEWRTMTDATVEQNLLRISIGVEDPEDLLCDLVQGLKAAADTA
jgi:cystathionine beta-lyase/cystathionine gamma-synthase